MENIAPDDFEPIFRTNGFDSAFGTVYLNRKTTTLGFRVTEYHTNVTGNCHGGAMATFADMQIAAIVRSGLLTTERHTPTISLSVDYIAPAPLGAWVEANVILIKETKSLIFTQALITTNGEPVARANVTYRNYSAVAVPRR
ncbi:PaaI family thioesterase [Bradyrhizobium sp. AZCC 2230]|uniref:PaaI family thioesterase n=1 Tax=Bradyrhizobium sp. AZCC 2230 TaxID=3117021 RepID=UPI002FF0618A